MPKDSICSRLSIVALSIFTCFAVSSCSTSPSETKSTTNTPATTAEAAINIENCGRTIAISKKPERILVVHPSMTEILVSIGAQDQILGQVWGQANYVDAEYQASVDKVKTISDDIPSQESIVELAPDLIVASGDFWFDGTRLQTLDYFEKQGIPVFINSSGCGSIKDDTLENTWNDLEALGKLTGHEKQARDVKKDLEGQVQDSYNAAEKGRSAALIQMYEGEVYAFANGLYSEALKHAGFENAFNNDIDSDSGFSKTNVEAVLDKNPDYLFIIFPNPEAKEDDKKKALEVFSSLDAVKNHKVQLISENTFVGGIGTPLGIKELITLTNSNQQ